MAKKTLTHIITIRDDRAEIVLEFACDRTPAQMKNLHAAIETMLEETYWHDCAGFRIDVRRVRRFTSSHPVDSLFRTIRAAYRNTR